MIRVGSFVGSSVYINESVIENLHFIMEHIKRDKYIIYTEEFEKDKFYIEGFRKHNTDEIMYKMNVQEFKYISSNGSSYMKELHLFPEKEYSWEQFKYLKKKER